MKSFETDIKKYTEKIHLKVSERRELRERVLAYMEYHPLKKQASVREEFRDAIPSESFITLHFNIHSRAFRVVGSFMIFMLILAPFAAEKSVPGEVLYLVKTGVNETIQGSLADSPYEKIQFETKLMERRIAEARTLASKGKLTEDVQTKIAEDVKGHTQAVQDGIDALRTEDADRAAIATIAFNSSLEVQSAILDAETNSSKEDDSSMQGLLSVVNEAKEEVGTTVQEEDKKPSFDTLIAQVEIETTRAHELFISIKESATPEEIIDIERRLEDVNRLTLEAKKAHERTADASTEDLVTALGFSQKLIVFMTDIDVRKTIALEAIVPVVLSPEEREIALGEELALIAKTEEEIRTLLASSSDASIVEKVEAGFDEVATRTAKVDMFIKDKNLDAAEVIIKEARAFIDDMRLLVEPKVLEEVVVPEVTEPVEEVTGTSTVEGDVSSETASSTGEVSFGEGESTQG